MRMRHKTDVCCIYILLSSEFKSEGDNQFDLEEVGSPNVFRLRGLCCINPEIVFLNASI